MGPSEPIHEPLGMYKNRFKAEHAQNVSEFFEELVKKANIDEEANNETVKLIRKNESKLRKKFNQHNKYNVLKLFIIILIILSFVISFILLTNYFSYKTDIYQLFFGIGCVCLGVLGILLIIKVVNKKIKLFDSKIAELKGLIDKLYYEAWLQMEPLNELYDWDMARVLVKKTVPIINIDPYFDNSRFNILKERYGLTEEDEFYKSVINVESGDIIDNPFVILDNLNFEMAKKTYHGSLYITWTTTRYVNGKHETVRRRQTLHASVVKPYPRFYKSSYLIYGNEAAPDLIFKRSPTNINSLNEKQIERKIKRREKALERLERRAIKNNTNFTALTNTEFEVLFNALNRNNEVQFRLLFTPLAQKQMLEILKDKSIGYGDNFSFIKNKKLNYIYPNHLNSFDLACDPRKFIHYDINVARKNFNDFHNNFFKVFYFSLAPILAIPLYQQHKSHEAIYKKTLESSLSKYEHEAFVNYLGEAKFKHPKSITSNILKTKVLKEDKEKIELEVTAYGFRGVERVDYVPKYGGDGKIHHVPVPWIEYIPVEKETTIYLKVVDNLSRNDYLKHLKANQGLQNFIQNFNLQHSTFNFRKSIIAIPSSENYEEIDKLLQKAIENDNKN